MEIQEKLTQIRKDINREWNKPKAINIRDPRDKREVRSYETIRKLHIKRNELKK